MISKIKSILEDKILDIKIFFQHKHFFKIYSNQVYYDMRYNANRINVRGTCVDCNKEIALGMLLEYDRDIKDHLLYINPANCYRLEFDAFYNTKEETL